jgi:hypothetical protein
LIDIDIKKIAQLKKILNNIIMRSIIYTVDKL